ncbi:unnamed protein product [Caenorhabditis bovis]|uniref:RING-type E3 ubiquitin transferase n=1 Tax=Caenorhabditis bovis TaxID=2654633 RepID=A0A8S1F067_9PELO|nr:unnamed protein product [Caenorhabditis bovis]
MPSFFCHQCNRTVPRRDGDFVCGVCNGEFIEEISGPDVEGIAPELNNFIRDLFRQHLTHVGGDGSRNPSLPPFLRTMAAAINTAQNADGTPRNMSFELALGPNDLVFRDMDGNVNPARIQLNISDATDLPTFMSQLFDQVAHPELRRNGFSEDEIQKYLPMTHVTAMHVENGVQCTTCFDTFKENDEVGKLDCDHIFHRPCIEPWLKTKSSCPVCRQPVDILKWKERYNQEKSKELLDDLD